VRRILVSQGWLARHFGYGNVEIFTESSSKPKGTIAGVGKPGIVKDWLEMILAYNRAPISKVQPTNISESQENESHTDPVAILLTETEPYLRDLKISLFVATPVAAGCVEIVHCISSKKHKRAGSAYSGASRARKPRL
jgi:hypothetical protein